MPLTIRSPAAPDDRPDPVAPAAMVRRLVLTDFRSYAAAELRIERRMVALMGPNGAGKTNILEALSFLTPGRGLRRALLDDVTRQGSAAWALSTEIEGGGGSVQLGTGIQGDAGETRTRLCRIDRVAQSSATAFAEHIRVVWLTPTMDGLFLGSAGERRRFLDRLVLAVDAEHGTRVNALERALRSRNRLLEDHRGDAAWLDAIERELAELAVAVAAARSETVRRLGAQIRRNGLDPAAPFPWAELALDGAIEQQVLERPALDIEEDYRRTLHDNRWRDRAAGRTLVGPHLSDLVVHHGPSATPAARASTGQQKALLIGLVLAHARLVADMAGFSPVILLDEVAAHLDPERRAGLYDELDRMGAQVWMTGADPAAFAELGERADCFQVATGTVSRA